MTDERSKATLAAEGLVSEEQVRKFIQELIPGGVECRKHQRVAFHCPVTIYDDKGSPPIPALIRDISVDGLGLVLDVPLRPVEMTIRISRADESPMCARINILWCRSAAKHCYICGGTFVRAYASDPISRLK